MRFLLKALKAPVGSVRRRKAGTFKKVAEHEWDRVLAEKHILAAAAEHKVPKKQLEDPEVMSVLHEDTQELHKHLTANKPADGYWTVREWKYGEASERHKKVTESAVKRIIADTGEEPEKTAPGHDSKVVQQDSLKEKDYADDLDATIEEYVLRVRAKNQADLYRRKVSHTRHWAAIIELEEHAKEILKKMKVDNLDDHFDNLVAEKENEIPPGEIYQDGEYPKDCPAFEKCGIKVKIHNKEAWNELKDIYNKAFDALYKKTKINFRGNAFLKVNPEVVRPTGRGDTRAACYTPLSHTVIVSPKYSNTIAHEFGHALDHKISGWDKNLWTRKNHPLKDKLVEAYNNSGDMSFQNNRFVINPKIMNYLLEPTEIFARCFDAWVRHNVPDAATAFCTTIDSPQIINEESYQKMKDVLDEVFTSSEVKKAMSTLFER